MIVLTTILFVFNIVLAYLLYKKHKQLQIEKSFEKAFGEFYKIEEVSGDLEIKKVEKTIAITNYKNELAYFTKDQFIFLLLRNKNWYSSDKDKLSDSFNILLNTNWKAECKYKTKEDAEIARNEIYVNKIK